MDSERRNSLTNFCGANAVRTTHSILLSFWRHYKRNCENFGGLAAGGSAAWCKGANRNRYFSVTFVRQERYTVCKIHVRDRMVAGIWRRHPVQLSNADALEFGIGQC